MESVAASTLYLAAYHHRRLGIPTDHGIVRGYLTGLDETYMRLFASWRVEASIIWGTCLVPRTSMVFIDHESTVFDEDAGVQARYHDEVRDDDFKAMCEHVYNQLGGAGQEEGQ